MRRTPRDVLAAVAAGGAPGADARGYALLNVAAALVAGLAVAWLGWRSPDEPDEYAGGPAEGWQGAYT